MRKSRSAWLLSKGTAKLVAKASTCHLPTCNRCEPLASRMLFARAFALGLGQIRVGLPTSRNDQVVVSTEPSQRQRVQSRLPTRFGSMYLFFEVEQQVYHALGPGLLEGFLG
jgi:hypothetical protein